MAVATDYTKTPVEIILDLINKSQTPNTDLVAGDVTLGAPVAGTGKATTLTVTAKTPGKYTGDAVVNYNRIDFAEVKPQIPASVVIEVTAADTYTTILAKLNAVLKMNLVEGTDVVAGTKPTFTDGKGDFVVTAQANSLVYFGTMTIVVFEEGWNDLDEVIKNKNLDGLVWNYS